MRIARIYQIEISNAYCLPEAGVGQQASSGKESDGHPGRVVSLSFLGSPHAPAVLSTTSAGYCGVWSADSLADPAISSIPLSPSCDTKILQHPSISAVSSISSVDNSSASSMSVQSIVGRVDGALLIHSRGGGSNIERLAKGSVAGGQGHSAPITCIATPPTGGSVFRDLAVTCSMDWSMKLWSLKVCSSPQLAHLCDSPVLQNLEVIFNFDDCSDEITCAAFNTVNPCLFAFADVSGNIGLRAIDRALDAGIAGAANVDFAVNCMGEERAPVEIARCCCFNCCIAGWSCDGKLLALGGLNGEVDVCNSPCASQ